MTETLTGKQVTALLAQDEPPEIEQKCYDGRWYPLITTQWSVAGLLNTKEAFRVKPTPQRHVAPHPDTRTVVQQMVEALENACPVFLDRGKAHGAAIQAGQKLLKELQ